MGKWQSKGNKKGWRCFGFTFIVIMAWVIFSSITFNAEAGCEGDCMSCHPTLKDSADHIALKSCVACHNVENKKPKLFNHTTLDSGCGTRCFQCHNDWPKDAFHSSLNSCLNCHEK